MQPNRSALAGAVLLATAVITAQTAFASRESEPAPRSTAHWNFSVPSEEEWPWRVYAGAASGYGSLSGSEFSRSAGGAQIQAELTLAYQSRAWVLDGGLGWLYNRNSGQDAAGRAIELRTRMGIFD